MKRYGVPALSATLADDLNAVRNEVRSPAEHEAAIPAHDATVRAITVVRDALSPYYPDLAAELKRTADNTLAAAPGGPDRASYFAFLEARYRYMDLGGISPRVGSRVVRIGMTDLFIPLRALPEDPGPEDPPQRPARMLAIDELLANRRAVVLGDPGAGKTTLGRFLAYSLSVGRPPAEALDDCVPIVVRAFEYAEATDGGRRKSLHDFIVDELSDRYGSLFDASIRSARCLVVIDGLDEVPDPAQRVRIAQRVDDFAGEYPELFLLVSSRAIGYRQNRLQGGFDHVVLAEFDDDQIQSFLGHWHRAIETESSLDPTAPEVEARVDDLWEAIEENQGVRKLAGNPLLLTIIALANWRGTRLPSRRVEVYEIATETLIENWPLKQRGLQLDAEEILRILEPIAFAVMQSGRQALLPERELRPMFDGQVAEVKGLQPETAGAVSRQLLRTIEEHTGFFVEKGLDENGQRLYGFLHQTFAEYLAARYFAEAWSRGELDLRLYAHEPRWREVVLLTAGRIGSWATAQATRFVQDTLTLGSADGEHIPRDLLLAADMVADSVRVNRELHDMLLRQLAETALRSNHPQLRRAAGDRVAAIVEAFGLEDPAALVAKASGDGVPRTRTAGLLVALGSGSASDVRVLLDAALEDRNSLDFLFLGSKGLFGSPRPQSMYVLSDVGAHLFMEPDPVLVPALRDSGLPLVEGGQLARKVRPKGAHLLVIDQKTANLSDDQLIRALTVGALSDLGFAFADVLPASRTKKLLAALVEKTWSDPSDRAVKYVLAASSLEFDPEDAGADAFDLPSAYERLAKEHPSSGVRAAAVRYGALDGAPASAEQILATTLNDSDGQVSAAAAREFERGVLLRPSLRPVAFRCYSVSSGAARAALARGLLRSAGDTPESVASMTVAGFLDAAPPSSSWELGEWFEALVQTQAQREVPEHALLGALSRILDGALESEDPSAVVRRVRAVVPSGPIADALLAWSASDDERTRVAGYNVRRTLRPEERSPAQLHKGLRASGDELSAAVAAVLPFDLSDEIVWSRLLELAASDLSVATQAARALARVPETSRRDELAGWAIARLNESPAADGPFALLWELRDIDATHIETFE